MVLWIMDRIPEPELMNDSEQALAYAQADFADPHNQFVHLFGQKFSQETPETMDGFVLDLGCGPADVTIRFAKAYPQCFVHGIDGAEHMLGHGREAIVRHGLESRISLYCGCLPEASLPRSSYDVVMSNSLLHHLHRPSVMWESIKRCASKKAVVFIMDLFRPESQKDAKRLVEQYANDESPVLKKDFFNSLCASFSVEEVDRQLKQADLKYLSTEIVSDRHLIIYGRR